MHGYLRHLANFAHVVEAGAITTAANRLGTSPSTLSESVKVLEAHLGEALLERRRSGVVPTGRGLTVYADAQEIVAALHRAMGAEGKEDATTLRISLPSELAHGWFDAGLAKLTAEHPNIALVLMIEDSLLDHTKYARDLHIRAGRKELRAGMTALAEGTARAVMVGAPALLRGGSPEDMSALAGLTFIGRPRTGKGAELTLQSGETLRFDRLLQVSDVTARLSLARAGLGVTTCLDRSIAADLAAGRLVRLCRSGFDYPVTISLASPHKRPPRAAEIVARALASCLAP